VKLKSFSTNNKNNNKKNNVGGAWGPVSGSKKTADSAFSAFARANKPHRQSLAADWQTINRAVK